MNSNNSLVNVHTRSSARQAIIQTAHGMVNGTVPLIEGCRMLVQLRSAAEIHSNPTFDVLVGIESETDDYPVGSHRSEYAPAFLARKDAEVSGYLESNGPAILSACRDIIREIEASTDHPNFQS